MTHIGQPERATQNRVIALFRDELHYRYLGDWTDRDGNSNIEDPLLSPWLKKRGYTNPQIVVALYRLFIEANNHNRTLYANNQAVYNLLRYGVQVKTEAGQLTDTIQLIDWEHPERNDFAIAEEVTLAGDNKRRPDLVLYVNGIAIGVLELKNSRVSIGDGIRQCLSNQTAMFHERFFSTVQFIFAGNDSEGRIWLECLAREATTRHGRTLTPHVSRLEDRPIAGGYGPAALIRPRLGQRSFRVVILDEYGRRCAVTSERTLPALEAAHIRDYTDVQDHTISNGILLRADIHNLFDSGYVTVTPDYRFEVSRRIKEEFENGRDYYKLHGSPIRLPDNPIHHPAADALSWHNEMRYLG